MYGKVLVVGEAGEGGLRHIRVILSPDGICEEFLSTKIFSFKSAREYSSSQHVSAGDGENLQTPILLVREPSPASAKPYTQKLKQQSVQKSSTSAVSREDLLSTLNGLLHRLSIPIDMGENSMLQKVMQLNDSNSQLEEQVECCSYTFHLNTTESNLF